jgi:GTPase
LQNEGIKSNETATVEFRFIRNPEFIRVGTRILFREGRTKGIGLVTKIEPFEAGTFDR